MGNESQSQAGLARDSPPLKIDMACGGKVEKRLTFSFNQSRTILAILGLRKMAHLDGSGNMSHILIIKFFPLFILNPFVCGGVGMIKHSGPYSRVAKPCSTLLFFFTVWLGTIVYTLLFITFFLGQDYQQIWPNMLAPKFCMVEDSYKRWHIIVTDKIWPIAGLSHLNCNKTA